MILIGIHSGELQCFAYYVGLKDEIVNQFYMFGTDLQMLILFHDMLDDLVSQFFYQVKILYQVCLS